MGVLLRPSPRCHVTLIAPAPLTTASASLTAAHVCPTLVLDCLAIAPLNRPDTLKTEVWTPLTEAEEPSAVGETAGSPLSVRIAVVLAGVAHVAVSLARLLSAHNSMMVIVAAAVALPAEMFPI